MTEGTIKWIRKVDSVKVRLIREDEILVITMRKNAIDGEIDEVLSVVKDLDLACEIIVIPYGYDVEVAKKELLSEDQSSGK
jgi:hypothetical protein